LFLRDEETQELINGDIEIDLTIYGINGNDDSIEFFTEFEDVNTPEVCISSNLSEQNLYLDTK